MWDDDVDILLVNEIEAQQLSEDNSSNFVTIASKLSNIVSKVIITLGSDGVILCEKYNKPIHKLTNKEKNFAKIESNSNSSSAIASLPKIQNKKSPIITLKFLDDTWVQLRDLKNEIIFSQLMNKNDEYSYDLD